MICTLPITDRLARSRVQEIGQRGLSRAEMSRAEMEELPGSGPNGDAAGDIKPPDYFSNSEMSRFLKI